jgi:hypothetical protein
MILRAEMLSNDSDHPDPARLKLPQEDHFLQRGELDDEYDLLESSSLDKRS